MSTSRKINVLGLDGNRAEIADYWNITLSENIIHSTGVFSSQLVMRTEIRRVYIGGEKFINISESEHNRLLELFTKDRSMVDNK